MEHLNRNLTEGNVARQLFSLTWPMLFGMLGMVIFNLVDTYFLGKLGVGPLAAIGFTFPVIMFLNGIAQGVGIGTSSLISRNVITADRKKMKTMASSALLLGLLLVVLFVALGISTIRPLFTLLGAEGDVLDYIHDYMSVWYLGVPFVVLPMVGNNIVRATGDTFTPGMLMVASAVINTILDPLLIFGYGPFPELGIKGAALATVIARSVSMVIILVILIKREKIVIHPGSVKKVFEVWRKVFYIADLPHLDYSHNAVVPGVIARSFHPTDEPVACRIRSGFPGGNVALMVISALGSVMIHFHWTEPQPERFQVFSRCAASGFRAHVGRAGAYPAAAVRAVHRLGFHRTCRSLPLRQYFRNRGQLRIPGTGHAQYGCIQRAEQTVSSTIFIAIGTWESFVPLAWLGSELLGLQGVMWAGCIANVTVGIASYNFLCKTVRKVRESHVNQT